MDIVSLKELWEKKEELDPELEMFVSSVYKVGPVLQHPLIYLVPLVPEMNALANYQFRFRQEKLEESIAEKNWRQIVAIHEKPHRLPAFLRYCQEMPDTDWWVMASSIWIGSENVWQYKKEWERIFSTNRPGRDAMMEDEEKTRLASLPDTIEIYRGCKSHNRRGWSWTLDNAVAVRFSTMLKMKKQTGLLLTGKVEKKHIVAYFEGRGEDEIIINPRRVEIIEEKPVQ